MLHVHAVCMLLDCARDSNQNSAIWSSTANRRLVFFSAGKVHFRKMLSVTLTFETMTLKCHQCHADLIND